MCRGAVKFGKFDLSLKFSIKFVVYPAFYRRWILANLSRQIRLQSSLQSKILIFFCDFLKFVKIVLGLF